MSKTETKGSLTIVGTGIRTVGHLTTEAIVWMARADELVYVVADPVTEEVIRMLNPKGAVSLQKYYVEGKQRLETYREMVEDILYRVRSGKKVCGAFYGHPGVFAYPPHEAIRRARSEGYEARMLPGISSEDCLFADLGIDPAVGGCQSYEATDFLMNGRVIDPSSQLILWQVGALGDWTYQRNGYDLRALPLLLQRLCESYHPEHGIVVYEAAIFPGCEPRINTMPLYQLNAASVSAACTLYIPPGRASTPDPRFSYLFGPSERSNRVNDAHRGSVSGGGH